MEKRPLAAILAAALLSVTNFSAAAQTAAAASQPIVVAQDESGGATSGGAASGGATAPAPVPAEAVPAQSQTQELPAGPAATPEKAGFLSDPLWIAGGAVLIGAAVCAAVCFQHVQQHNDDVEPPLKRETGFYGGRSPILLLKQRMMHEFPRAHEYGIPPYWYRKTSWFSLPKSPPEHRFQFMLFRLMLGAWAEGADSGSFHFIC